LKIAVNTRLLIKDKLEGIGWFAFETLKRITESHPEHEFIFFFDRKWNDCFVFSQNVTPVILQPQARHPFLYFIWFEFAVAKALKKYKADIFLSPDGYLSLSTKIPSIAVFHDLNFEHYPNDLPLLERLYYRYFFPRYAHKANRIATVSEYSKSDICKQYDVSPDKIDVVYNGANEVFSLINKEEENETRMKYTDGHPYFLFVGALHPRKNIANLFRAFDKFHNENDSTVRLLVVGNKKWWTEEIREAYNNMANAEKVIFAGRLGMTELKKVMASALALTYISYFEGFGIPIVEAFRSGTAVVTANVTSMPEVAGDAALLCDPFSVNSISDALKQIAFNDALRNELIQKGNERQKMFSWDLSAQRLWATIETLMKNLYPNN